MTDEYQIDGTTIQEKDGSNNLIIKNIDEATIQRLASALDVDGNDVSDGSTTVYDASNTTIGDGSQSANLSDIDVGTVSTEDSSVSSSFELTKTTATLSSGEVSYQSPYMVLKAESGGSDTLTFINGADGYEWVVLRVLSDDITIQHSGGDINLNGGTNKTLDTFRDRIVLHYDVDNSQWFQISFEDND